MFSDKNADEFESASFASGWRKTISLKSNSAQTDKIGYTEGESQTATVSEAEVQTDLESKQRENKTSAEDQINSPSIAKFLARATPLVEAELRAIASSRTFDSYQLLEDDDDDDAAAGKIHTLEAPLNDGSDSTWRVTNVCWGGGTRTSSLVASFEAAAVHESWCDHETMLCMWNLDRRDFDPGTPHLQLPMDACISVVQFHHTDPALLATGAVTGEVAAWTVAIAAGKDGSGSDTLLGTSAMNGHHERVTALRWLRGANSSSDLIASASLDGRVLVWRINTRAQVLDLVKNFTLSPEALPRSLKVSARSSTEVGITCLSINSEDIDIAMAGTEAGAIYQLDLSAEDSLSYGSGGAHALFSPHRGRVVDVACSPFHRDVFASLGSDQRVQVHSLLSPQMTLLVLHHGGAGPLTALEWSPARPSLLMAAAAEPDAALAILEVHPATTVSSSSASTGTASASEMLCASERQVASLALTSLAFNRNLVAAGDSLGRVHVWKLSSKLATAKPQEMRILNELLIKEWEE